MPMAALSAGESAVCRVSGREILVANVDDQYYAVEAVCTHARQQLSASCVRGSLVFCPRHGGQFDLRTGRCVKSPPTAPLRRYAVIIERGKVCVET